jgi:hypothetical protein
LFGDFAQFDTGFNGGKFNLEPALHFGFFTPNGGNVGR